MKNIKIMYEGKEDTIDAERVTFKSYKKGWIELNVAGRKVIYKGDQADKVYERINKAQAAE